MAYSPGWTGKGWLVNYVDTDKIKNKEIEKGDRLTFHGSGSRSDTASVVKRKDKDGKVTVWAKACHCSSSATPETVTMTHDDLGDCSMWVSESSPKIVLDGEPKGGPTGAVWTAEEDGPP